MPRGSYLRLQQLLQHGKTVLLEGQAEGLHNSWTGGLLRRALHGPAGCGSCSTGLQLPLQPQLFQSVLTPRQNQLSGLFRRLFSSEKPPSGFEGFARKKPPSSSKPAGKAAEGAKKAASEQSSGGSGGKAGGDGDERETRHIKQMVVNVHPALPWVMALGLLGLGWRLVDGSKEGTAGPRHEISFQEFHTKLLAQRVVARLEVVNNELVRVYIKPDVTLDMDGPTNGMLRYYFKIGSVDAFERKLDEAQRALRWAPDAFVPVKYVNEFTWGRALLDMAPTLLLLGATFWLMNRSLRQMTGGLGGGPFGRGGGKGGRGQGGIFGMGRANVTTLDEASGEKITFKDVAGCDEAKAEIMEFVDFLKKPEKYKELGAKIPKGALLVGPPGTGKTLLAKATAGEAGVPFLSISGSDFMEMFVGVGPARVRDLFAQARSQSPSIIFIDEIDAIGRARGRGGGMGSHDERENTLNQLLVEMDGFATTSGVVVLAGTNRPDILDQALLRPGRFDRTITVDNPDINGREQIFRVHMAKLKLSGQVDSYAERLATLTPGMSGADIANVCNEAALVAARNGKENVSMKEFESAIDRVIGGLEKKNKVISKEERRTVAIHESGHAVVSWFLEHAEPLLKVSIVPRGTSTLGFAQYLPKEHLLLTKEQLLHRVCALLGGRAAEQVLVGRISTGAVNDLERVTQMAYALVAVYGMNEKVGMLSYRTDREAFSKPYSSDTAKLIDEEVRAFVDSAYKHTVGMVEQYRELISEMSSELLSKEVLNLEDVERILGKRVAMPQQLHNVRRGTSTPTPALVPDIPKQPVARPAHEPEVEDTGAAIPVPQTPVPAFSGPTPAAPAPAASRPPAPATPAAGANDRGERQGPGAGPLEGSEGRGSNPKTNRRRGSMPKGVVATCEQHTAGMGEDPPVPPAHMADKP